MDDVERIAKAVLVEQVLLRGALQSLIRRRAAGNRDEAKNICTEIQAAIDGLTLDDVPQRVLEEVKEAARVEIDRLGSALYRGMTTRD